LIFVLSIIDLLSRVPKFFTKKNAIKIINYMLVYPYIGWYQAKLFTDKEKFRLGAGGTDQR